MAAEFAAAKARLDSIGQGHVFAFWARLTPQQQASLLAQVEALDLESLPGLRAALANAPGAAAGDGPMQPAEVMELGARQWALDRAAGAAALSRGEVGVILVAGGQGSRLGYEGPKGCFKVGPLSQASLFEIHAHKILALERRFRAQIPFYIMTSDANDRETREFFQAHRYFGLSPDRVHFFVQGMWPALWNDGRIILDRMDHIFLSPDGHGGTLSALKNSGKLQDMRNRGVKTLFYFQVDNPLVEIAEPAFVGVHVRHEADMSVKVCAKRDPEEPIGVVVTQGAVNKVVEYSELTAEQKRERRADGNLRFRFGSVAIHIFSLDFLCREADAQLPLHIAHKKVPYCDADGKTVKPEKPNAFKFEKFIFDVIPDSHRVLNVEFARENEFSPVKNATGEDSPASSQRDMMLKFARWMEEVGVAVPRNERGDPLHRIEIDPCYALGPEDLRARLPAGFRLTGDVLLA